MSMADEPQAPQLPEPNPVTMRLHQRQSFWQIKFPLLVGVILVSLAALGVLLASASGQGDNISKWSDISLIWLLIPMILLTVIVSAATAALVYMLAQMLPVLPRYTHLLLGYFLTLSVRVKGMSNAAVEPFLRMHSTSASVRAFWRSLLGKSG